MQKKPLKTTRTSIYKQRKIITFTKGLVHGFRHVPMTNDHHCSKLVKIDRFRKGVGRMPFRMLQVFQGILFEFGKTVRILSKILEVYGASWVLEYLRILSYTPGVSFRIRANSVAYMCLFAQWNPFSRSIFEKHKRWKNFWINFLTKMPISRFFF